MQGPPRLITNDDFFGAHYRAVADAVNILGPRLARLRDASLLARDIEPILSIMIGLCAASHRVLRTEPGWSGDISIARLLEALESTAALAERVTEYETIGQAAPRIREHTVFFERHFDLERDYADGRFLDAVKKELVFGLCVNTAQVMLANIMYVFRFSSADPRQATTFFDYRPAREACPPHSRDVIERCRAALEGWCSDDKTWLLYDLARREKPEVAVEIGIFGGRSIIPLAQALRDNGSGSVIGVEAWTAVAATEQVTDFANDFWWSCIDYHDLKLKFLSFVLYNDLTRQIRLIEAPSNVAHHCIGPIDFLHIDGSHAAFSASQDVVNYYSKLKSGGILVFDDVNWPRRIRR